MPFVGDGLDPIEQDASFAQLQAAQLGTQAAVAVALPPTGFVGSIDGLSGLLTFANGTNISITNDGVGNFTFSVIGLSGPATALSHVDTVPPNSGNDSTQGFSQFSTWINTLGPTIFMCTDATPAAAVWLQISN